VHGCMDVTRPATLPTLTIAESHQMDVHPTQPNTPKPDTASSSLSASRARTLKRWIAPLVLCAVIVAVWASGLHHSLDLETIKAARGDAKDFLDAHYAAGIALFALVYIAVVALSLPAASLLTLLGGFLFGVGVGVTVVAISATIGATIIFLIARSSFGEALRERAGGLYNKIADGFNDNAFTYLLFLRLAPIFPFVLINIVPALVNMRTRDFIVATFIGILPGTTVYVYTGQSLGAYQHLIGSCLAIGLAGLWVVEPSGARAEYPQKNEIQPQRKNRHTA